MNSKKPLYIAKSLSQLNESLNVDNDIKKAKPQMLLISMKKIIPEAEKAQRDGDEERNYLLLMKFIGMASLIRKRADFTQDDKNFMKSFVDKPTLEKHMNTLQTLSISLKERYEKLYGKKDEKVVSEKKSVISESTSNNIEKNSELLDVAMFHQQNSEKSKSCKELFDMMENAHQFLILDCRPREDFEATSISHKYVVNVPEEIILPNLSAAQIKSKLPNESSVYWELRHKRMMIIVDWDSERFERNSTAWLLREILRLFDPDNKNNSNSFILEGGYEKWRTIYPAFCLNPNFSRPKPCFESDLDLVQYPSDILESINGMRKPPKFDRSTKKDAIEAFKNKNELQLLEENLSVINKSLQNEKDLLVIEEYIKNGDLNHEKNEEDQLTKEEKLYKIFELETKQKDFSVNEKVLINHIEEKRKQPEHNDIRESTKVARLEQEIAKINEEKERIKAERDKRRVERENSDKIQQEKKLKLNQPNNRSNIENVPLNFPQWVPDFDRSTKPQHFAYSRIVDDDFEPVKGKVENGLCGLKNLGNTCYMNSVVQCLSNTFLLSNNKIEYFERKSSTKGVVVKCIAAIIKLIWRGEYICISPMPLKILAAEQNDLFVGSYQQDAHEFLILLIDWLQSDLQTIKMEPQMSEKLPSSEKAWLEYTKGVESIIHRIFYGQIKSTLKCSFCRSSSDTFEAFSNLSLELPTDNVQRVNIGECFYKYFQPERIDGWTCEKCQQKRSAEKKFTIAKLPPVLIVHLKRFQKQEFSAPCRKNNIYIDFPLTDMNMLSYVSVNERASPSNSKHVYSLSGVINHYGKSMESGHYTAFCKNLKKRRWSKFDDQNVSFIDTSDIVSSASYVLFYTNFSNN